MKTPQKLATALAAMLVLPATAQVVQYDISPPGTTAAVGLSPENEVPPVAGSSGSGGEILQGIRLDLATGRLDYAIGYGFEGGFTNLTGPVTAAHIHGPAGVDGEAGPIHNFVDAGHHLPAADPSQGGVILGSVMLDAAAVAELRAGQFYINLHTAANPGGELRGQLIEVSVDNVAPEIACPEPVTLECTSADGTPATLVATVSDADGDDLEIAWLVNDAEVGSETVPGSDEPTEVSLDVTLGLGEHTVVLLVSDGTAEPVTCEFTVTVVDTTAPEIRRVAANPAALWPPNHKMRTVTVRVVAEDACGGVTNRVVSVESNEPENGLGDGNTDEDWEIVDDLTVRLRAERGGIGSGRIYTLTVESEDESGNVATATTTVKVAHDQGRGRGIRGRLRR